MDSTARRSIRPLLSLAAAVLAVVLVGCAPPAGPVDAASPSRSPTPTAACPQVEGVDLPPDCAPYDPQESMDLNDQYRERMDIDEATREASAGPAETVRAALEGLRAAGDVTVDQVQDVLISAGLADPFVREDYGDVLFGVNGPKGGCIFGEVSAEAVVVDVGGYILDGGCLPAQ